jgi:ornithine carbamoyltransferase
MASELRHFLTASSFGAKGLRALVNGTLAVKRAPADYHASFAHRNALIMFSKPSLRTRVSFEAGMTEMGGLYMMLIW